MNSRKFEWFTLLIDGYYMKKSEANIQLKKNYICQRLAIYMYAKSTYYQGCFSFNLIMK